MQKISSGVESLDNLTDSFNRGDNVIWEVDAGTSSPVFVRNFVGRAFHEAQKVIYVSFNRSAQTVLNDIREILSPDHFILIDCFTAGKGKNDNTFLKFYERPPAVEVVKIDDPRDIERFTETLNAIEDRLPPGVRYVFDSLTGIQDLWGDENDTHRFFTYMCPRLYDLGTVAYWMLEKDAHSQKFKANLRHVTQVVFDLYKRKNNLYIKALKLEGRQDRELFKPHLYEIRGDTITITPSKKEPFSDIGARLKETRTRAGLSQKELADRVELTPSFLSQIESNQATPSLSTFLQICRILDINPGQFLEFAGTGTIPWHITKASVLARPPSLEDGIRIYDVINGEKLSAKLVILPPGTTVQRHFFYYRKEEIIHIVDGNLSVTMDGKGKQLNAGDTVYLKDSFPSQWRNEGGGEAQILVIW